MEFTNVRAQLSRSGTVQALRDLPLRLRPPQSFSQHGEDLYIFENLFRGTRQSGTYVDIGASHPARLSNTYMFYRKGWRGLIVEPIKALLDLHKSWRPDDIHAQCLIGGHDGDAEFYQLYPSVLSTTSQTELEHSLHSGSVLLKTDILPKLTLPSMLKCYLPDRSIDLMSVDVEGVDTVVARQIADLPTKARPQVLCIESNSPEIESELREILRPAYRHAKLLACNLILW